MMKKHAATGIWGLVLLTACLWLGSRIQGSVLFETKSSFNQIRVIENNGVRILSFDGSMETKMSVQNPLYGHFEYIDYFHMPLLWNPDAKRALMVGLGGGSIQRSYQNYHPRIHVDTVEIDPMVVQVAKDYFYVKNTQTHDIHVADGRKFLEDTDNVYDVVILDAYSSKDGKSSIPFPLATREFFEIIHEKLTPKGVLAYNVIGDTRGVHSKLPGAIMRSMLEFFPRIYLCPASDSHNVVVLATKSGEYWNKAKIAETAARLSGNQVARYPLFQRRAMTIQPLNPQTVAQYPILYDKNAPPDGFLRTGF